MKKTTHIFYDEMDVHKIVSEELQKAKPFWVEEITDAVSKIVGEKFDKVMTTLDKFVGEIKARREEQSLHQNQHDELTETLETFDHRIKKLERPIL